MKRRTGILGVGATSLLVLSLCVACQTGKDKGKGHDEPVKASKDKAAAAPAQDTAEVGGARSTVVVSLSNNGQTGHYVNRVKAQQSLQKFQAALSQGAGANDKRNAEAVISAGWLAGATMPEMVAAARQLVDMEMKKNVKNDVAETVKLELALAAIRTKKYSMAEYFLDFVDDSKNPHVNAGALTCQGMIAMLDDRVVEAVTIWEKALQVSPKYAPALLNIGFVALRYGDYKTASAALNQMPEDWYAQSGLVSAQRLAGNNGAADQLCTAILAKQPSHKPTLINCALHEWQAKKDYKKARDLLVRATKVQGDAEMDELAFRLVTDVEMDLSKDRANSDRMKAEEQQKAAASKAAAPAPQGKSAEAAKGKH